MQWTGVTEVEVHNYNRLYIAKNQMLELLSQRITDKRVIEAISRVPRESFIPLEKQNLAYEDGPLSIGYGQTISQPYIVALMMEALYLRGSEKVLEMELAAVIKRPFWQP